MSIEEYREYLKASVIIDNNGCWIWQGSITGKGYGRAKRLNGCQWAHRNSYTAFKGPITKQVARHTCDVMACINPEHLIDSYQYENIEDCVAKGRHIPYMNGPEKKFTEETYEEVRKVYDTGWFTGREIANAFDMSERQVLRAVNYEVKGK